MRARELGAATLGRGAVMRMAACLLVLTLPLFASATALGQTTPAVTPDEVAPPLPPPRPAGAGGENQAGSPAPEAGAPPKAESEAVGKTAGAATCEGRLTELGVKFETRPTLKDGACGTPDPLLVTQLPEGITVAPPATVTCPVAEALARWALGSVKPEADRHLRKALKSVAIGTSYECRNQRSGQKLSEHAFANGVDVMSFAFEGRAAIPVQRQPDGSPEAAFIDAVRSAACVHFATVLGPGSDAAHADHLHLDMRERKAGYRICQ
jgi:hypothetical protein